MERTAGVILGGKGITRFRDFSKKRERIHHLREAWVQRIKEVSRTWRAMQLTLQILEGASKYGREKRVIEKKKKRAIRISDVYRVLVDDRDPGCPVWTLGDVGMGYLAQLGGDFHAKQTPEWKLSSDE